MEWFLPHSKHLARSLILWEAAIMWWILRSNVKSCVVSDVVGWFDNINRFMGTGAEGREGREGVKKEIAKSQHSFFFIIIIIIIIFIIINFI